MGVYDFLNQNQLLGAFTKQGNVDMAQFDQYSAVTPLSYGEYALQSKNNPNSYTFISKDTTGLEFNPWTGKAQNLAITKQLTAPLEDYQALSDVLKMPISQIAINPPPAMADYSAMEMPKAPVNLGLGNTPGDMAIKAAQTELSNSSYFSGN